MHVRAREPRAFGRHRDRLRPIGIPRRRRCLDLRRLPGRSAGAGPGAGRAVPTGPERAAALRPAIQRQGLHRRGGPADDGGVPRLRLHRGDDESRRRPRTRRRSHSRRQDQYGPVRYRTGRSPNALWRRPESLRCQSHPRWLKLGRSGFGSLGSGRVRLRNRHRRVRSGPGGVQQHRRPQADTRSVEPNRNDRSLPLPRHRVHLCASGGERAEGARGLHGKGPRRRLWAVATGPGDARVSPWHALHLRRALRAPTAVLREQGRRDALRRCAPGAEAHGRHGGPGRLRSLPDRQRPPVQRTLDRGTPRRGRLVHSRETALRASRDPRGHPWSREVFGGRFRGRDVPSQGAPDPDRQGARIHRRHGRAHYRHRLSNQRGRDRPHHSQRQSGVLHQLREFPGSGRSGGSERIPARGLSDGNHDHRSGLQRRVSGRACGSISRPSRRTTRRRRASGPGNLRTIGFGR